MSKLTFLFVMIVCGASVHPATSMSRWFSATYHDLRFTLHRYGHCVNGLTPLRDSNFNETDYLSHQMRAFLDQGDYNNEQLANISLLMDDICKTNLDLNSSYPISVHLNVSKYDGPENKEFRCRAIDEAMDSMYYVFKRAALNNSEPLDFSVITFYPNATDRSAYYNLTDLINTCWIKSDTMLENICHITNSVKDYVRLRSSKLPAQSREQSKTALAAMLDYLDRLLDPILGLQKRIYLESSNRFEQFQTRISSGFGTIRDGLTRTVKTSTTMVSRLASSSSNATKAAVVINSTVVAVNSTVPTANSTFVVPALNSTNAVALNQTSL